MPMWKLLNTKGLDWKAFKAKQTALPVVDWDFYLSHVLFLHLNLQKHEIGYKLAIMDQIIEEYEACAKKTVPHCLHEQPNQAFSVGTHMMMVRYNPYLLTEVLVPCPFSDPSLANPKTATRFLHHSFLNHADNNPTQFANRKYTKNQIHILQLMNQALTAKPPVGFYLHGTSGVGKTFLFLHLANFVASRNKTVVYLFLPELQTLFFQALQNHSLPAFQKGLYHDFVTADYCFVDDLGAEHSSSYFYNNCWFPLLNERCGFQKPTYFNSNFSLQAYWQKLVQTPKESNGKLLADRISQRINRLVGNNQWELH